MVDSSLPEHTLPLCKSVTCVCTRLQQVYSSPPSQPSRAQYCILVTSHTWPLEFMCVRIEISAYIYGHREHIQSCFSPVRSVPADSADWVRRSWDVLCVLWISTSNSIHESLVMAGGWQWIQLTPNRCKLITNTRQWISSQIAHSLECHVWHHRQQLDFCCLTILGCIQAGSSMTINGTAIVQLQGGLLTACMQMQKASFLCSCMYVHK